MKLCISNFIAAFLFTTVFAIAPCSAGEQVGEWSTTVNGLKGRLITKEDKPFYGTQMVAVYVELANVSDVGNAMAFYFDPDKTIVSKMIDESGKTLAQPPTAADIITTSPFWLALPWDGTMRFRVSVSGYGVYKNSGTNVQMMSGNWLIKPDDKQKYYLEAKFIARAPENDKRHSWNGELDVPRVLVPHS
jgi:hypothetical protein